MPPSAAPPSLPRPGRKARENLPLPGGANRNDRRRKAAVELRRRRRPAPYATASCCSVAQGGARVRGGGGDWEKRAGFADEDPSRDRKAGLGRARRGSPPSRHAVAGGFLFLFFIKIYFRFGNLQKYTPAARQRGGRDLVARQPAAGAYPQKNDKKLQTGP